MATNVLCLGVGCPASPPGSRIAVRLVLAATRAFRGGGGWRGEQEGRDGNVLAGGLGRRERDRQHPSGRPNAHSLGASFAASVPAASSPLPSWARLLSTPFPLIWPPFSCVFPFSFLLFPSFLLFFFLFFSFSFLFFAPPSRPSSFLQRAAGLGLVPDGWLVREWAACFFFRSVSWFWVATRWPAPYFLSACRSWSFSRVWYALLQRHPVCCSGPPLASNASLVHVHILHA